MPDLRDGSLRRAAHAAAGLLAALGALYGVWLGVAGGADFRLFGRTFTSHEPFRPMLIAAVALAAFMLAGGDGSVTRRVRAAADRLPRLVSNRHCMLAAAALTVIVLVVSVTHVSKLAGGSDSYGYLSQADLWLEGGHLSVPVPWAREAPWPEALWSFSPLGYRPSPAAATVEVAGYRPTFDPWSVVPIYSPGLPMLMAAAKWIGGPSAVFLVVPSTGALFVLATFGLGCRLGSPRLGLLAAVLVAVSPTTVRYELASMSDVPVATAWALAWWAALGVTMMSAWGAALALAAMLLIRPNLLPIAAVLTAWAIWRVVAEPQSRRRHLARAAAIGLGLGAGMLVTAAVYWLAYGSPLMSGYGDVSYLFGVEHILPNLRNYGLWYLGEQTFLGYVGLAALVVPIRRLWPGVRDRSVIVAFAVSCLLLVVQYVYFSVFDNDSYLRFFLPAYPLVLCGLAAVGLAVARRSRLAALGVTATVALLVLVLGVRTVRPALDAWQTDARFLALLARVRAETPENSVILSMQHSGSVRYHAGRVSLRWDYVGVGRLDRAIDWMSEHGVRTYAVLEVWELAHVRRLFAGESKAAVFELPPVLQVGSSLFFDLTTPLEPRVPTAERLDGPSSHRALPPVPRPVIVWKQ